MSAFLPSPTQKHLPPHRSPHPCNPLVSLLSPNPPVGPEQRSWTTPDHKEMLRFWTWDVETMSGSHGEASWTVTEMQQQTALRGWPWRDYGGAGGGPPQRRACIDASRFPQSVPGENVGPLGKALPHRRFLSRAP